MRTHLYAQKKRASQCCRTSVPRASEVHSSAQLHSIQAKSNEEGLAEHAERLKKFQRLGNSFLQMGPPRSAIDETRPLQRKPWIQKKLTLGQPGDKYEQEADRVASHVVKQISAPTSIQPNQGQSIWREQESKEEIRAKELSAVIQRRQAIVEGESPPDLESAINSARGSGYPLDAGLQQSMGQVMGADFGGVRVHTDPQSDLFNQSIHARAFTTGQDLFFRQGAYQPGNRQGQELIAHELTHVLQQNGRAVRQENEHGRGKGIQRFLSVGQGHQYVMRADYEYSTTTMPILSFPKDKLKSQNDAKEYEIYTSGDLKNVEDLAVHYLVRYLVGWEWTKKEERHALLPIDDENSMGQFIFRFDPEKKKGVVSYAGEGTPKVEEEAKEADINKVKEQLQQMEVANFTGPWTGPELYKMLTAFNMLPSKDKGVLKGLDLIRVKAIPKDKQTHTTLAYFSPSTDKNRSITVSDDAFKGDTATDNKAGSFVGKGATALPPSFQTILHELGHAVEHKTELETKVAYNEAVKESNESVEKLNKLLTSMNLKDKEFEEAVKKAKEDVPKDTNEDIKKRNQITGLSNALIKYGNSKGDGKLYQKAVDAIANFEGNPNLKDPATKALGAMQNYYTEKPNTESLESTTNIKKKAYEAVFDSNKGSVRLQNFVNFVTKYNETPDKVPGMTHYAKEEWPNKPQEYFAEAYSLWFTDPDYLKQTTGYVWQFFDKKYYQRDELMNLG